ncbi:histidine kinase [Actinoplanes sp. NPDC023714]|uniref:sensor histidine kinase n=1 Tax=Actinoplanes sp. NPDC023714 TaxID=3154322 RepID=UPI003409278B
MVKDRAIDVAAILVSCFCALLLAGSAESSGRIQGDETFFALLLGFAGSLSLWWRRRNPLAVAFFLTALSPLAETIAFAGLATLYTLVVRRRTRAVLLIVVLNIGTGFAYSLRRPDVELTPVAEIVLNAALLTTAVAIALAVRSRYELIDSLRHRAEQAEDHARLRADRLRALERERIAREMHDSIAHRISLVSLHAGALQLRRDLTPDETAKAAATIRKSAHEALEELRAILGVLRAGDNDSNLRPQPDLTHLGDLLAEAEAAGMRVRADNRLNGTPVSAALGRTVYRLVQEGLTNAGKHNPAATPVDLVLERTPEGELHVHLSNPLLSPPPGHASAPAGPPPPGHAPAPGGLPSGPAVPGAHAGLLGLSERVELVGGRLRHGVRASPGAGLTFDLEAWLPWPKT